MLAATVSAASVEAAGAQPAPGPVIRFVHAKRIAGPGEILSFTVHCPRGWTAFGGTIVSNPSALPVLYAKPRPGARWTFAFDNRAGRRPAEVRVRITCVRVRPPGKRRWVRIGALTVKSRFTFIGGTLRIRGPVCPRPMKMAGRGVEFRSAKRKRVAGSSTRPTGFPAQVARSWVAKTKKGEAAEHTVVATGREALEVRVSARCVAPAAVSGPIRKRRHRPATHRFPIQISLPEADAEIAPGVNRVKAKCPGGDLAVGTGFRFPAGSGISLFRSFPLSGPGLLWDIDSPASTELFVRLQAQCVDTDGEWR